MKILIIDDQSSNIDALLIILGFLIKIDVDKVCEKSIGGEKGFNAIINDLEQNDNQFCSYNLILMDCNMPFMDGYQCSEMIRTYLFNKGVD
jgi:CheY-like chemotaxis protein